MNKKLLAISSILGGVAFFVVGAVVAGLISTKTGIAVLDLDRVKKEAEAYKQVNVEATKYSDALKARSNEEKKNIEEKIVALKKKIDASGKQVKDFQKETDALNKEVAAYQEKVRFQAELIYKSTQAAMSQVTPVAQSSLKEISDKMGLKVILPKPLVTYYQPCVDITDDFINFLDSKEITVEYPDPASFAVPVVIQNAARENNENGAKVNTENSGK